MTDETPVLNGEQRTKFLEYVRAHRSCNTRAALKHAGVTRTVEWAQPHGGTKRRTTAVTIRTAKAILDADPELADDYHEARGRGEEEIRAEIRRRAIDGVEEPVFHQGQVVGTVTRYSDRLLYALAKSRLPEYQETARLEHVGPDGGPIAIEDRSASLGDLARVLEAAGALAEINRGAARPDVPAAREVLPAPTDR